MHQVPIVTLSVLHSVHHFRKILCLEFVYGHQQTFFAYVVNKRRMSNLLYDQNKLNGSNEWKLIELVGAKVEGGLEQGPRNFDAVPLLFLDLELEVV